MGPRSCSRVGSSRGGKSSPVVTPNGASCKLTQLHLHTSTAAGKVDRKRIETELRVKEGDEKQFYSSSKCPYSPRQSAYIYYICIILCVFLNENIAVLLIN